jgi:hydroxypyruvate isomerase
MTFGPLFVLALVFCSLAAFDWHRLPFCARASLAAAMVFAIAGFQYPGADLAEVVEPHRDGLAYMVELARAVGFAAVLVSMALLVRGATQR